MRRNHRDRPPESLLVCAGWLAARSGCPFIADLRDPWLASHHRPARSVFPRRIVERGLFRWALERAAGIVTIHPAIAEEVKAVLPGAPVELIGQSPVPPDPDFAWAFGQNTIDAVYAGSFSPRGRSFDGFLSAARPVLAAEPRLRLHVFSALTEADRERAAGVAGVVLQDPLPLSALATVQRAADALVLYNSPTVRFPGGKLSEYLCAERPLLVLGDGPWRRDPVLTRACEGALEPGALKTLMPAATDIADAQLDRVGALSALITAALDGGGGT